MAPGKQPYSPSTSDAAVRAKTGKDWASWFSVLDKAGASKLEHKAIAALLVTKYGIPGWWSQMVTVEYERARGLRERHQTSSGFSVSVTKTIMASTATLYAATANAVKRRKWFPPGEFGASSSTAGKYFHGAWNDTARLDVGYYPTDDSKTQIAIQVSKLARKADVESERTAWKAALLRLKEMLED
jgi:hypothetical protein